MKMKQKREAKKVSTMSIMIIFILFLFVGLTIAKYITTGTLNRKMQVAKWNVTIGESGLVSAPYNSKTIKAARIAPGTEGYFQIQIDAADTEVGVKYDVKFTDIENKPTNMYFMVGDTRYNSFDELSAGISGTIDADATDKLVEIPIKWVWDYETGSDATEIANNDKIDTQEGMAGSTMTFNANVTATQVQPTK